jgi:hypothetical protein
VHIRQSSRVVPRLIAETVMVFTGVALLACAVVSNQLWLDRHFLPSFFLPRLWYVRLETLVRVLLAALGATFVLVLRPRAGRFAERSAGLLRVAIAALLALAASELALRYVHLPAAEWLVANEEPLRRPDPLLGWTFEPARTGHGTVGGRTVDYAIDAAGYRVRRVDEPVDFNRPTILFTGESVMFGEGLTWDETVPAQVEAMTGVQSANLAVHGFGTDQTYLRLRAELPRFRRPVAVVALFMTALFGRNLDDDRPHLGPGLVWLPAHERGRLASIAGILIPYRSDAVVERGVAVTRELLRAIVALARARGAIPLVVVPQLGPEAPVETALRRLIFDDSGVPYVLVETDAAWRLAWDRHPNARADRAIADAVAARLQVRVR